MICARLKVLKSHTVVLYVEDNKVMQQERHKKSHKIDKNLGWNVCRVVLILREKNNPIQGFMRLCKNNVQACKVNGSRKLQ